MPPPAHKLCRTPYAPCAQAEPQARLPTVLRCSSLSTPPRVLAPGQHTHKSIPLLCRYARRRRAPARCVSTRAIRHGLLPAPPDAVSRARRTQPSRRVTRRCARMQTPPCMLGHAPQWPRRQRKRCYGPKPRHARSMWGGAPAALRGGRPPGASLYLHLIYSAPACACPGDIWPRGCLRAAQKQRGVAAHRRYFASTHRTISSCASIRTRTRS